MLKPLSSFFSSLVEVFAYLSFRFEGFAVGDAGGSFSTLSFYYSSFGSPLPFLGEKKGDNYYVYEDLMLYLGMHVLELLSKCVLIADLSKSALENVI